MFAGQRIDDDLRDRRAVCVVEKRPSAESRAVVIDFRRAIEAGRGKRRAREPSLVYQFLERDALLADPYFVVRKLHGIF